MEHIGVCRCVNDTMAYSGVVVPPVLAPRSSVQIYLSSYQDFSLGVFFEPDRAGLISLQHVAHFEVLDRLGLFEVFSHSHVWYLPRPDIGHVLFEGSIRQWRSQCLQIEKQHSAPGLICANESP